MRPVVVLWLMAAASCLAPAATLAAQSDSSLTQADERLRLGFTVGGVQLAQRVPSIAPGRFAGTGLGGTLSLERLRRRSASGVGVEFARTVLENNSMPPGYTNQVFLGGLTASHLRRVARWSTATLTTFVGARLEVVAHADVQSFGPMRNTNDVYGFLVAGFGPAVRMEFTRGSRRITEELSAPLIGVGDIPYVNAKVEGGLRLNMMTASDVQSIRHRLSLRGPDRGWHWMWSHELVVERHVLHETRVYARQALSASMSGPVGRKRS